MSKRERITRWLAVLAWAALISLLSTQWFTGDRTGAILLPMLAFVFPSATPTELRELHMSVRKVAHFTEYLILSVLLYRALRGRERWSPRTAVLAFGLAAAYAGADELHQWLVPGRTAAARDCAVDVAGATAGQALLAAWSRARRRAALSAA